ncbi:hypothetical protein ER57_11765 [Smithella sp. SCADC]|nr:hypothetical protein ER57_11765 [Smithella sp. SCADC]
MFYFRTYGLFHFFKIITGLQVEPALCGCSEITRQSQRRIGCNALTTSNTKNSNEKPLFTLHIFLLSHHPSKKNGGNSF